MNGIKKASPSAVAVESEKHLTYKKQFYISALCAMIVLPIICCFLNYFNAYYGGDIEHVTLSAVLNYTTQIMVALVPYASLGLLIWGQHRYGLTKIKGAAVMAFIGILIPYVSLFVIEALLGSIRVYYKAYLLYSLLYLFDAVLLCATITIVPLIKRSQKRRKNAAENADRKAVKSSTASTAPEAGAVKAATVKASPKVIQKKKRKLPRTLLRASLYAALIRLAIGVSTELYYAIVFFYQLSTEYYREIYTGELVTMLGLFALQFIYAALGLFIMRAEMRISEKNYRYEHKRKTAQTQA